MALTHIMPDKSVKFEKTRSRIAILSYVLQFTTSSDWEPESEYGKKTAGIVGFVRCGFAGAGSPKEGDLVLLSAVRTTKWVIGWLRGIRTGHGDYEYLVESLEDGTLCWWNNVGISYLNRRDVRDAWQWTDRQWKFNDRWSKVVYRDTIGRARDASFHDDGSVTVTMRRSFAREEDPTPTHIFPDWKKVKVRDMVAVAATLEKQL